MSPLEKRAWLSICSMFPPYLVYFAVQIASPGLFSTMLERIGFLAAIATVHALAYIGGLLVFRHGERSERVLEDDRDHAIDARATRVAYFVMLTALILVGVVMPFDAGGWEITNAALFYIVLTETIRDALIIHGYRRGPRLAH
ncbi:MAG: DUF2178 domain-containing protein [Lysobacter sp.]